MFENKYVKALKPYKLVSHEAWDFQEDKRVLKLDWNEATIPPSPQVAKSISVFLKEGNMNWYPDVNNMQLLGALSKYSNVPECNVQYFASSDSLHEYIVRAFIEPGDRILIVAPTYDNFRAVVESNGALTDFYYLGEDFDLDFEHFCNYINLHSPKIVYICNPNNPTGNLYSKELIESLVVSFTSVLFVVDEAYFEFTGVSCSDIVVNNDNILISRTFSKAFALAGFRVGYVISSQHNINILTKIRNPKNISTFSQLAALAALDDISYMQEFVKEVHLAKKIFESFLTENGFEIIKGEGNFTLLRIDLSQKLSFLEHLSSNLIYVRDYGHVKGMENYIRITIGTCEQMARVQKTIELFNSN
jgi:histidinol-phosphate aminotransferase